MSKGSIARVLPILGLVLSACGTTPSVGPSEMAEPTIAASAAATPSEAVPGVRLVAIGDSIPVNLAADCPGCTGFVDSYGATLEAQLGERVAVLNRSRHDGARTIDIVEQLKTDDGFLAELAAADVIVMSVGFNDQPPFADAHDGCPDPVGDHDPIDTVVELAADTSQECVDTVVQEIRAQIAQIFAAVREQSPGAAIGALTAYDTWLGWSALDTVDPGTRTRLLEVERYWFHQWREALCAEAQAAGAVCIDVYSAFNGPDGRQPAADFVATDYTHPSQAGNDLIRDLLVEADLIDVSSS